MDVAALILSVVSLLVAGLGTYLSNRRSKEAIALSKRAAVDARWSAIQEAVQRLLGFDPAAEPIGERLQNLRIAAIALVDDLPSWTGLDHWLDAERALGAAYGRQVMEMSKPDDSVEQRVTNLDPLMTWAGVLSSNLRFLRSKGHDAASLERLSAHAKDLLEAVYKKNGWEPPPTSNPSIRPLDE